MLRDVVDAAIRSDLPGMRSLGVQVLGVNELGRTKQDNSRAENFSPHDKCRIEKKCESRRLSGAEKI
jgi:hypothetical protein